MAESNLAESFAPMAGGPMYFITSPNVLSEISLVRKAVNGAGLSPYWTTIDYGQLNNCYASGPVGACTSSSPTTRTTTVSSSTGEYRKYTFGNKAFENQGQLLRIEEGMGVAAPLRTTVNTWTLADGVGGFLGGGTNVVYSLSAFKRLVQESVTIVEQGASFSKTMSGIDSFLRPTVVTRSSPWSARTDTIEYHDDLSLWALGQVRRTATDGIETSRTEYAWKASPTTTYSFGKLQKSVGYNADGTIATVTDGNSNVTTLGGWKRGVPQSILHPDGTSQSSYVDDQGLVRHVTNEVGAKTCYDYDLMGRIKRIDYPSETATGECNTSAWQAETIAFDPVQLEEHGLGPGHWTQRRRLGNRHVNTYFDALWRPVLEESLDAGNVGGTLSQIVKRYDAKGRLVFQSYPQRGVGHYLDVTQGVYTEHDALNRVTSISQDSEQGLLTTLTEYLPNHQTRVVDPRLGQTTTSYQVFDQPTYDYPVVILGPTGNTTEIPRDVFGKPLEITRK